MGNWLSLALCNIHMQFYKSRLAHSILPGNRLWFRYVDDSFSIRKDHLDIGLTLTLLKGLVPSIQFAAEKEEKKTTDFWDVKVISNNNILR